MKKKPFYPEYMTKKRPRVPRCLCSSLAAWLAGAMSPSLVFRVWAEEDKAKELEKYNDKYRKYMCWKRQLSREGWKALYRQERLRQQYPPEGADHDRGRKKDSGYT